MKQRAFPSVRLGSRPALSGRAATSALLLPLAVVFGVSYGLPLLWAVTTALDENLGEGIKSLTSSSLYVSTLTRTLRIALEVALLCIAIGYPLAAYIAGASRRLQTLALVVLLTPIWTSLVVRGYAWVVILRPDGLLDQGLGLFGLPDSDGKLLNTHAALLIGTVHVLLPFAVLPMVASFRAMNPEVVRAAASLGAGRRQQWRRVIVPLTAAGALAGGVLVFLMALGFYIIAAILGGPKSLVMATLIDQQVRILGNLSFASLLAIVLLLGTLAVALVLRLTLRLRGAEQ